MQSVGEMNDRSQNSMYVTWLRIAVYGDAFSYHCGCKCKHFSPKKKNIGQFDGGEYVQ